jgi:hypothetical protein
MERLNMRRALLIALLCVVGCSSHPEKKVVDACAWEVEKAFPSQWRDVYNPTTPVPTYMSDCMAGKGFHANLKVCPAWHAHLADQLNALCYKAN